MLGFGQVREDELRFILSLIFFKLYYLNIYIIKFEYSIMEKDIGKIKKNDQTDIVVRIDDFGGKVGLTIREFTTSEGYTGFTKSGTRIPLEALDEFKTMIAAINAEDLRQKGQEALPNDSKEDKNNSNVAEDNTI